MFLTLARAVMLVIACMAVGWTLEFVSAPAGDSTGALDLVSGTSVLVVYASFALLFVLLLVTALGALVVVLQWGLQRVLRSIRFR
jgi:uncharacterized membrane protein YqjE